MKLSAGRLDRRITFQHRVGTTDPTYGTKTYTWEDIPVNPTVWAEVQDVLPSRAERLADGVNIARRPARVRTRWRDDVTGEMRVKVGERVMQIVAGPAELGRREGLEMLCEELSTSGEAP